MIRKFVIFTEILYAEGENKVTAAVRGSGAAWSHYFPCSWMVVDPEGRNVQWWTVLIKAVVPATAQFMVVEVSAHAWFGRCPQVLGDWLRDAWLRSDPTLPR